MQTSNKELILLVDDDPGNLKRAQTILGEEFRISATTWKVLLWRLSLEIH